MFSLPHSRPSPLGASGTGPNLPRPGNGLGAKYGTREPKSCAARTAPAKGAPSPEQARQYFICDAEHEFGSSLFLVANVKVQVAPVAHPPNQTIREINASDLDPSQPVWDIRGSLTQYQCSQTASWDNPYARTHNCTVEDHPTATGYCFKNTFAEWHCVMSDIQHTGTNTQRNMLPPDGN